MPGLTGSHVARRARQKLNIFPGLKAGEDVNVRQALGNERHEQAPLKCPSTSEAEPGLTFRLTRQAEMDGIGAYLYTAEIQSAAVKSSLLYARSCPADGE